MRALVPTLIALSACGWWPEEAREVGVLLDQQGRCTARIDLDLDLDGTVDAWEEEEFDANGLIVHYVVVDGPTGVVTGEEWWSRDEAGNLLAQEYDEGGDGVIDSLGQYDRDDEGLIERYRYELYGPGGYSYLLRHAYDAEGREVWRGQDNDEDGDFDREVFTEWEEDGLGKVVFYDWLDESYDDSTRGFRWNDWGRDQSFWLDYESDGAVDWTEEWTYDPRGCPLTFEQDHDGDGALDWTSRFTCSDEARVLDEHADDYYDGHRRLERHYAWRGGELSSEVLIVDAQDETPTLISVHYAWDHAGNPSRILRESDWGTQNHRIRYVVTSDCGAPAVDLFPRWLGGGWLFGHPDRRSPPIGPP